MKSFSIFFFCVLLAFVLADYPRVRVKRGPKSWDKFLFDEYDRVGDDIVPKRIQGIPVRERGRIPIRGRGRMPISGVSQKVDTEVIGPRDPPIAVLNADKGSAADEAPQKVDEAVIGAHDLPAAKLQARKRVETVRGIPWDKLMLPSAGRFPPSVFNGRQRNPFDRYRERMPQFDKLEKYNRMRGIDRSGDFGGAPVEMVSFTPQCPLQGKDPLVIANVVSHDGSEIAIENAIPCTMGSKCTIRYNNMGPGPGVYLVVQHYCHDLPNMIHVKREKCFAIGNRARPASDLGVKILRPGKTTSGHDYYECKMRGFTAPRSRKINGNIRRGGAHPDRDMAPQDPQRILNEGYVNALGEVKIAREKAMRASLRGARYAYGGRVFRRDIEN